MRSWKPQPSSLILAALAALALAVAGAAYLVVRLAGVLGGPPATWPIDRVLFAQLLATIALLLLAGALAYRVGALLTLTYSMDRNGLYIGWLGNRAVVPLQQIERITSGALLASGEARTVQRFSTRGLKQSLIVQAAAGTYAISPQDSDGFVQELEQRRRLGAVQQLAPGVEAGRAFSYAFWDDRVVRGTLILALLLNLALLGWLMAIYPGLPALIDLRADATGAAAAFAPKHQLLFLPLAGGVIFLVNLGIGIRLYRSEPTGAQLLQIASVGAQVLFGVAALTILR